MLAVRVIRCLADNYAYLLVNTMTRRACAIDPVEPQKIQAALASEHLSLAHILTTHHHSDHAGGNRSMKSLYPHVQILAGDQRVEALDRVVSEADQLDLDGIHIRVLSTPCHTRGSVSYFCESGAQRVVFTGDTMFSAGCGRFFEGDAGEMLGSLDKLAGLPDDTLVYPGHEYTAANLKFAVHVDAREAVKRKLAWALEQTCTVPSTIGEEKQMNPFLKTREKEFQRAFGVDDPVALMALLRERKNNFRA